MKQINIINYFNSNHSYNIMNDLNYFYDLHDIEVNQKYNNKPYSYHLKMVVDIAFNFIHLLNESDEINCIIVAAGHDSIEDARLSYHSIKKMYNKEIAELIFCLTSDIGRTRNERNSDNYYARISLHELSIYIKLCDRIANTVESKRYNNSKFKMYKKEYNRFQLHLKLESQFEELWNELNKIYYNDSYLPTYI